MKPEIRQETRRVPKTCLVSLPWHSLNRPSLAVGLLRSNCAAQGIAVPDTYHGNLDFAGLMMNSGLGVTDYNTLADTGFQYALGEWAFARALNESDYGAQEMRVLAKRDGISLRIAEAARELAEPFVDLVVDGILAGDPELVGFTCTFSQNTASLAVAKRLKRRRPDVRVLFGGYNCESVMGDALHRTFGFVDLVLRGESDQTFPELLRALGHFLDTGDESRLAGVPGLCWRDAAGVRRVNQRDAALVPPAGMLRPDYTDWFAAFDASVVSEHIDPELVIESSRGCWWGEKHQCTFCGLNGSTMTYRAKPPDAFLAEILGMTSQYHVLDVTMIDNILPNEYLSSALPKLAGRELDLRIHYEVKANLSADNVRTLRDAGVWSIQPGIESLVDDALRRMDKGVRGLHNVRVLRDAQCAGITVEWNWLYGFPGEDAENYRDVLEQLPALLHLQPPTGVSRIELQRFSPNFDQPEIGFTERTPAEAYRCVYDVPEDALADLVYSFDTPPLGLTEEQVRPLREAVDDWIAGHPVSSLTCRDLGKVIVVRDRRLGWPQRDYLFEGAAECLAWRELGHGRSARALRRLLARNDIDWDADRITQWLHDLWRRGLVFTQGGYWLALAVDPATMAD